MKKALQGTAPGHLSYFTDPYKLPGRMEKVQELRNPAAHSKAVGREEVLRVRDDLLGIGRPGVLVELVGRKG